MKRPQGVVVLLLIFNLLVAGCTRMNDSEEPAPSPSNSYSLSQEELTQTTAAAERGDVQAMNKVAAYYLINQHGDKKGWYWIEKAAEAGDPEARQSILGYYSDHESQELKDRGEMLRKKWRL